jgi:hypothetical protein
LFVCFVGEDYIPYGARRESHQAMSDDEPMPAADGVDEYKERVYMHVRADVAPPVSPPSPHCPHPAEVLALLGDPPLPSAVEGRDAGVALSDADTPSMQSLTMLITTGTAASRSGVFDAEPRDTATPDSGTERRAARRDRRASLASVSSAASSVPVSSTPPRSPARVSSTAAAMPPGSPLSPCAAAAPRLARGWSTAGPPAELDAAGEFWQCCRERGWTLSHVVARLQSKAAHDVHALLARCGTEQKLAMRKLAVALCLRAGLTQVTRRGLCEALRVPTTSNGWLLSDARAIVQHVQTLLQTEEIPDMRP